MYGIGMIGRGAVCVNVRDPVKLFENARLLVRNTRVDILFMVYSRCRSK